MRRSSYRSLPQPANGSRHDWQTVKSLLPFLAAWKARIALALFCLICAKLANVAVPLVFKDIIDALGIKDEHALILVPLGLLAAYATLRFANSLFSELRELIFARVTQRAMRAVALRVFSHLHALSLRFHLERQTGGLSRDIERGSRSINTLLGYTMFSILPTLVEIGMVIVILVWRYDIVFALITAVTLAAYGVFTILVTNWRTAIRREANELDSAASSQAVDSLLNYETVKYFNNEAYECARYDTHMKRWEVAQLRAQTSLSLLNGGQALITSVGVALMMWRAAIGVANGSMTVGDIVLVNAFLMQLYLPLHFLGVLYREIRQSLTDLERLFALLHHHRDIQDRPSAQPLQAGPCSIEFRNVCFSYDPRRPILRNISFNIPAGASLALVGHSGSGKSTIARLLYRFYDVQDGGIFINGCDLRDMTQASVRRAIGIVPQDTVLFNDTLHYNILYGRPDAAEEEVRDAAAAAQLDRFITRLPDAYQTQVGERGLKLSGGEKQRVAIARTLLKNPPILIFDEATSALDSRTEKAIQAQLDQVSVGRTTLIIAHRLSTIMHVDNIVVLDQGVIVEQGSHKALLDLGGTYAQMWALQQQEIEHDKAEATA